MQGDGIDANIIQMYAEKKAQTGATFIVLLHQIEARFKTTKRALDLPVYAPSIVLMDWAPCHGKEFLENREGEEQSAHLWMVKEIPDMWVFFGIPQKSHLCNPGGQLPNPSMRKYINDRMRERAVMHGILVQPKVKVSVSAFCPPLGPTVFGVVSGGAMLGGTVLYVLWWPVLCFLCRIGFKCFPPPIPLVAALGAVWCPASCFVCCLLLCAAFCCFALSWPASLLWCGALLPHVLLFLLCRAALHCFGVLFSPVRCFAVSVVTQKGTTNTLHTHACMHIPRTLVPLHRRAFIGTASHQPSHAPFALLNHCPRRP